MNEREADEKDCREQKEDVVLQKGLAKRHFC